MREALPVTGKSATALPLEKRGSQTSTHDFQISFWVPGAKDPATKTPPYDDMLVRITEAQKAGVLKGILSNQGKADQRKGAAYAPLLEELISKLRAELYTNVPFIAAELPPLKCPEPVKDFNEAVHSLESKVPKYAVVSAEGLTDKGDKVHYDTASARTLGKRYVEKMVEPQK